MDAQCAEMRFPGTREGFGQAFTRFRELLEAEQLDAAARYNTELVFEEIVANLVKHAAAPDRELDVRVIVESRPDAIRLSFEDDGKPFDPRNYSDRAQIPVQERVGGFGLQLVRRAASALEYVRTPEGRNRLTVTVPRREAATPPSTADGE